MNSKKLELKKMRGSNRVVRSTDFKHNVVEEFQYLSIKGIKLQKEHTITNVGSDSFVGPLATAIRI